MFETILKMSLYGSVAALLVMLLRLIPKIPPRVKFILWGIVFLRLVIPPDVFTVPSPVNMQTVMQEQAIIAALPSTAAPLATNPQIPANAPEAAIVPDSTGVPVPKTPFDWMNLLEKMWLIGVSACVALMISTYLRVFRREKYETVIQGVYASDHFVSPAVIGLLRPKIVLPMSINPESADDIILHERTHIRRGDHITKLIFAFVAALHWINPIVWLAYVLAVRDMEMAVDEAVLRKSEGDIRKQYAKVLLNVAQERMLAFPGFGESDIKRRVKGVLNFKRPSRWIALLSAMLVIAAGVFLLTGNSPAMNPQPQEPLYAFKNQYVGDNSNTVGLLNALAYGDALEKTELLTQKEPYGIVATYDFTLFDSIPESFEQAWEDNAAVIFALVGNVDEIYFNSGASTYYTAYRKDFEARFGQDLREFAKDEAAFVAFLQKIQSEPTPSPTQPLQTTSPSGEVGTNDLLVDFTFTLPTVYSTQLGYIRAEFSRDGQYAGSIERRAFYPDEGGYGQLMDNHTEQIGQWEETTVDFSDNGAWRKHLQKVVIGHFKSDHRTEPLSDRPYFHTTYYLIFDEELTLTNYNNDVLTYQNCYALDFVTKHVDGENSTDMLSEAEIQSVIESFALKGELPYQPAISFDEMEKTAVSTLSEALNRSDTVESNQMFTAMGRQINDDLLTGSTQQIIVENNRRVWELAVERGGIRAVLHFDMDSGEVSPIEWSRITYSTIASLKREGYKGAKLTFIDGNYDPDSASVNNGQGVQPAMTPREAADIALRALYDMTGYQVDSCYAQTMNYDYLRADIKFSHVDSDKMYDYFCEIAVDTQAGQVTSIFINYYNDPRRHPFKTEDFVKPESFSSMNYGQVAQYYYENSSYGDRRPIVRFERSMLNGITVNLYLDTGEFYAVDFNQENGLPYRFFGPYAEGSTH